MILSNRKLKLIIIALLLLIFCWFVGIFGVKADTYVTTDSTPGVSTTILTTSPQVIATGSKFNNVGSGKLYLSIMYYNTDGESYLNPITSVAIDSGTTTFQCDIGNNATYNDEGSKKTIVISAICPVNFTDTGYRGLRIARALNTPKTSVAVSRNMTFINETGSSDSSAIITAISAQTTELVNRLYNNQVDNQNLVAQIIAQLQTNQTTINNIQNNTSDIKDSINDDSIDSSGASSSASSWNSKNATNGTITQLLTLPISLLQAIVNGIQTSCSSFSLGSLFGTNITLPCINISNLIGSGLFTTIDILFSGFMILSISKKMIKIFNDFTNLKSNQIDELYGGGSK